jgi:hypothetical protein
MNLDYTMPHYQEMALALLSGAGAAGATCNELFAKCAELLAPLGGKRYQDMKRLSKALTMLCRDRDLVHRFPQQTGANFAVRHVLAKYGQLNWNEWDATRDIAYPK